MRKGRIGVGTPPKRPICARAAKGHCRVAKAKASGAGRLEAAKGGATRSADGEGDPRAALRKAWERATALRRLWEAADSSTREWFMDEVSFDLNDADHRTRAMILGRIGG